MTKPKKAVAPRPLPEGAEAEAEAVDLSKQILELSFRGETHVLAWQAVPMDERMASRLQTRYPWEDVVGISGITPDITVVCILVWLARRASGEPGLSYRAHLADWPVDLTMGEVATRTYQADDPEADLTNPQS